jgi:hypothetical protein
VLFLAASSYALAEGDSTKAQPKTNPKAEKLEKAGPKQTTADKTDPTFKGQRRMKDVFIDKDGDGICDNRADGLSFEKHRKRFMHQKKGKGHGGGKK